MIVTHNGSVRFMTFGNVSIPIRLSVHMMADDVRHMSKAEHKTILSHEGVKIPGGMDAKMVMLMTMSFIQILWYSAENKDIPPAVWSGHADRLWNFQMAIEEIRHNPPTPKPPRVKKQLEIPGTPEPTADPREVLQ